MGSQTKSLKHINCRWCGNYAQQYRPNSHQCRRCYYDKELERRQKRRDIVARWKTMKGCAKCGFKGHRASLHIDHIGSNPTKGKGFDDSLSWKRIKENLANCQILCANCHAVKTYEEARHRDGRANQ